MATLQKYLAEIGRRGGTRSRRTLDPDTARRMVEIREARRAASRAITAPTRTSGPLIDTSAAAQAVQDRLLRRMSFNEKLMHAARLSRAVDHLAMVGLRQRHPADSATALFYRRAVLRLGAELAARVYGSRRGST
jgi:hypothetical protein